MIFFFLLSRSSYDFDYSLINRLSNPIHTQLEMSNSIHDQDFSDAYLTWLESQVRLFRKANVLLCRSLDLMKDPRYQLVPLHMRPDLIDQCCKLLNSEWKRSETARLKSLVMSSDYLPLCLLLLFENDVLGHCKVSLVHNTIDSVIIESFVIDPAYRSKGYGSLFLGSIEEYMVDKYGIVNIYLMTKGQEGFYLKNGYEICEPDEQLNNRYRNLGPDPYDSPDEDVKPRKKRSSESEDEDNEWEARKRFLKGIPDYYNIKKPKEKPKPQPKPEPKPEDKTSKRPKDIKFIETGSILRIRSIFEKPNTQETKGIKSAGPIPPPMPNLKPSIPICLTISNRTFMKKTFDVEHLSSDESSTE